MPPPLTLAVDRPEHLKVKLLYLTHEPMHLRSHQLRYEFDATAPFIEDVCVLLPAREVDRTVASFAQIFERLREAGVVGSGDTLHSFLLLDEDIRTLAYVEEEEE